MKAILGTAYGDPAAALRLEDVETPALEDGRLLVRVHAASMNAGDWRILRGRPRIARPMMGGLLRPKDARRGSDVAGVVEAVAPDVTAFAPGDEVLGTAAGAFAEYATPKATAVVRKPASLSFEEAAAIPVAAVTALQAVRDHGRLEPGQRVLLNGGGGGVGTFAAQLVKILGGELTVVCGAHNVELLRSLGADRVVDYSREDFTKAGGPYDLILDNAGTRSIRKLRSLLTPAGTLVLVGAVKNPIGHMLSAFAQRPFTKQRLAVFIAKVRKEDLEYVTELAGSGQLRVAIDRTYPLAETPEAYRYIEAGHARGKIVITVG
jgi:NADPH:quinone reductase-like Zn-dependent oxidoreductase